MSEMHERRWIEKKEKERKLHQRAYQWGRKDAAEEIRAEIMRLCTARHDADEDWHKVRQEEQDAIFALAKRIIENAEKVLE